MAHRAGEIRIGTSGWHYAHWVGIFYPEGTHPAGYFDYYKRFFDTVEVNNSFYRMPQPHTVDAWREAAPDNFLFAAKAVRSITHTRRLQNIDDVLDSCLAALQHLQQKLGPILFQLSPRWKFNGDRLQSFLTRLPVGPRYVFEFREPGWHNNATYRMLSEHNVALCIHDLGGNLSPIQITSRLVYVRLHGLTGMHRGNYDADSLAWWARQIRQWSQEGHDVCAYFNNDAEGYAPQNAYQLRQMLDQVGQPLPRQQQSRTLWEL